MMIRFLFVGFIFVTNCNFSQSVIKGKITNNLNKPLVGANIIVTKNKADIILAYAISNNLGFYNLNVNSKLDSLQIKVSFIGYTKQVRNILNKSQNLNFKLFESFENLKEIIIKNPPLHKRGDTISFSVSAFKNQKDRVIADVLAKMPGIDVLPDGKILYQGQPIQKYYIEGLDLLEGRYNLANNNLPADAVSKVQILENHQPIKLLDSLVFSNKTSLNIKLKKGVTYSGTAKLGGGYSPFLWDVNITPMMFSKNQQAIISYQANNMGHDISNEVKVLTIEELLDEFESYNEKQDWVTIQKITEPPFKKKHWLDNNAHLMTTNYLVRLKKDLDLKLNLSYINDIQQQIGRVKTEFFTPNDTINIYENTHNSLFFNKIKSKFILTQNTEKNFLKSTFQVNKYWDSQRGRVISNKEDIIQNSTIPYSSISNKLKLIRSVNKKLVTIKSVLTYSKTPQELSVLPGQFVDLLNNGNPFDKLNQNIVHSNFYTSNSFSFTKGIKKFTFIPKLGFSIHNQNLNTGISTFENGTENKLSNEFQNNLKFIRNSIYCILKTQYRHNSLKIELETPLKFQNFKRVDNSFSKNQKLKKVTFEPRFSIRKDLNNFWKTTISASLKNNFGNINQLYYGYLLNSYRNIQKYDSPILKGLNSNFAIEISYRNPIKSLFISGFYSFVFSNQNVLFGNKIDENGTNYLSFYKQKNSSRTRQINLRGSKFFSKIKTTLAVNTNIFLDNRKQLLNNILTNVLNKNIQLNSKINTKITEWFSLTYKSEVIVSNSKFKNQQTSRKIITQEHLINFNFYPTSNQYISCEAQYYKNDFSILNRENYFFNFNYKYSIKKSKIDLSLNWNNIFNAKEYTTLTNDAFFLNQSVYNLRKSQLLLSINFRF